MVEPVIAGRVQEIDQMKKILDHLMNDVMQSSLEDHKVLVTEVPLNDPKSREELVELMFSEFKVPKLYIGNQAVLSLFATGRTTGTVVDSGYGITHTVPVYEGYALPFATKEIPICGRDMTKYLHSLLIAKHPQIILDNSDSLEDAEKIKIEFGKVCLDYDAEMKAANDGNNKEELKYKLPSG
jgi:actin